MYWPNMKSVAFPVPEIIGGTPKIGQSLDTKSEGVGLIVRAINFSKIFHGLLFGWTL